MITEQINNSILFGEYTAFTTDLSGSIPVRIDTDKQGVPEILKDYKYPVSSWPVIINPEMTKELKVLTVKLPELIHRIPALYFNNNIKRIADYYYGGNEMVAEFGLMCHQKNIEIGCRLDLTLTSNGFKVLEANMGSSIGGWQVQSFESIIRKLHSSLMNIETADKFESRNTQDIYIKFLIDNILQHASIKNKEINIYIEIGNAAGENSMDKALVFFDNLLRKELKDRGLTGQAHIGSASSLVLDDDGQLYLNDKRIHGVLIFNAEREKGSISVLRSFIMDKLYFPDHLGIPLLGDKRNLSLLRELAEKNKFSREENALILQYIPWTTTLENRKTFFQGKEHNLLELISHQKDQFVIKAARGFQGKNVFVGKFLTAEEWGKAIDLAREQDAFIVQELSESQDFLAPDSLNQWMPHKLIWGAFGFGKNYGGVWVRMSPVKTDIGVINSATGAIEAIVYESKV